MPFPSNPTNNQQTVVNNIVYNYNSTKGAWIRLYNQTSTLTADKIIITNSASNSLTLAGGVSTTGNIVTQNNITASGTIVENTKRVATMSKAIAMSIAFGG